MHILLTTSLIIAGIIGASYLIAMFIGFVDAQCNGRYWCHLQLKEKAYDIPLKKIMFTYALGVWLGYWLFGHYDKNKPESDKLKEELKNLDELKKEHEILKKKLYDTEAELYLLTDKEAINV